MAQPDPEVVRTIQNMMNPTHGHRPWKTADYARDLIQRLEASGAIATRSRANVFMLSRNVPADVRLGLLDGLFPPARETVGAP